MGAGCAERFMSGSARGSGCNSPGLLSRISQNDPKRMRGKLRKIKQQLRTRMHDSLPHTGRWL